MDRIRFHNHVPSSYSACTAENISANVDSFLKLGGLKGSRCPKESWLLAWRKLLHRKDLPREPFVYIEVGCNKATDAIVWLRSFTQNVTVDLDRWLKETRFQIFACKIDWNEWKEVQREKLEGLAYKHFCIEPLNENFQIVDSVAKKLGYDQLGLINHQLAMSNRDSPPFAKFSPSLPGTENMGLDVGDRSNITYNVKISSIDKFVIQEAIQSVNVLKIDAEGNDPKVLFGALHTLFTLRPSYLAFEYHRVGQWKNTNLRNIIDMLDGMGYVCYWAMNAGRLIQLTSCWHIEYFRSKDWSNIVCHHKKDRLLSQTMRTYVE